MQQPVTEIEMHRVDYRRQQRQRREPAPEQHGRRGEIEEAQALGARVITIEECFELGTKALIEQIRAHIGDRKLYISLDIDSIDPAYAPGTGTPEVGGFSSFQMLQILRGLNGLNLVGADLVEVNPQYDHGGITSILAANLGFELISLMGNAIRRADD